ncbi:hypothetical protein [Phocaeicola sartorii]|uniref:hypothetical protein n=1 Tax=Phocaeicola sartorii TaxID=671267 RepID=UPI00351802D5
MMSTKKNTPGKSGPTPEYVDCIIFSILKEEKDLFIDFLRKKGFFDREVCETNACGHSGLSAEKLSFIDKNRKIRTCVVCSLARNENIKEMGNAAAYKLLYIISRFYKSGFYINIGVVGAFGAKVKLGEVFLVSQNVCVTKKDSNGTFSQSTAEINRSIVQSVFDKINAAGHEELLRQISKNIKARLDAVKADREISTLLAGGEIALTEGTVKCGTCITFPHVLKNKAELLSDKSLDTLKEWDIVDMEAYYFADWFSLMKRIDSKHCFPKSELLIVKSPSDTCEEALKHKLKRLRKVAMGNISEYVAAYLSEIHEFTDGKTRRTMTCEEYLRSKCDKKHLPRLSRAASDTTDYDTLFSLIAETNSPSGSPFSISQLAKDMADIHRALIIIGGPGKGENILLALIYECCASPKLYIDFNKLDRERCGVETICKCLLHLFESASGNYVLFLANLDSVVKKKEDDKKKDDEKKDADGQNDVEKVLNILDSCKDKFTFCITYNTNQDKTDCQFITEIKQKINANKEVVEITLNNICSYNEDKVASYVNCYASLFLADKTEAEKSCFIENCRHVISVEDALKKEIKHIDWQLMQLFGHFDKMFMKAEHLNIYEIISEYCAGHRLNEVVAEAMQRGNIDRKYFGELECNVYCRAFVYARYLYQILLDLEKNISLLNRSDFYLSDFIDYFMHHLLSGSAEKERICRTLLKHIDEVDNNIRHELLYLLSKNLSGDNAVSGEVKSVVRQRIDQINLNDIGTDEEDCMKIIQYRTYALRLKDSGNAEYLQLFVEKMKTDKRFRRVNLAFFLNYYSQKEFTYAEVVGMSKEMKGKISGVMLHNALYKLRRILREGMNAGDAEVRMYYYTLKSLVDVAVRTGLGDKIDRAACAGWMQELDVMFEEDAAS